MKRAEAKPKSEQHPGKWAERGGKEVLLLLLLLLVFSQKVGEERRSNWLPPVLSISLPFDFCQIQVK